MARTYTVTAPLCVILLVLASPSSWALPSGFVEQTVGGTWNEAVGITFASDGRMFVWERGGRVWEVENGVPRSQPLIDLSDEVGGWRNFGLLGFVLHPDFFNNGYIYLYYVVDHHHLAHFGTPSYNPNTDEYFQATAGRITRYTARSDDDFHSVDPSSRLILVGETIGTGFPILHQSHGTGSVVFGSDGTLLASCGDGASYSEQRREETSAGPTRRRLSPRGSSSRRRTSAPTVLSWSTASTARSSGSIPRTETAWRAIHSTTR